LTLSFPAVIKSIEVTESGIQVRLDISPPDISLLADLVDQEVRVAIALPLPSDDTKVLPFEPEDEPRLPKRHGKGRHA
jgi:hypothetical protein